MACAVNITLLCIKMLPVHPKEVLNVTVPKYIHFMHLKTMPNAKLGLTN